MFYSGCGQVFPVWLHRNSLGHVVCIDCMCVCVCGGGGGGGGGGTQERL